MGDIFGGGSVDYTGNGSGTPEMPTFLSNLNPDGTLNPNYKVHAQPAVQFKSYMPDEEARLNAIPTLNGQPLKNLEDFASGTGDSPWAQAQLAALKQSQGQAMGDAKGNAAASNTAAEDAMAAHGGLNTGAMLNLARNAGNNSTMAGQNVIGQGLQQQGSIRSQDAANRLGVAENLPGQEVQALQPALQQQSLWQQAASQNQSQEQQLAEQQQQYGTAIDEYNNNETLGGLNAQNQFNLTNYQNQIAKQAGDEQANAQANSGKK